MTNRNAFAIRKLDAAQRCFETKLFLNCVIKIELTQPEPQEYMKYELPTYVLRLGSENWDIFYYKNAQQSKLDSLYIFKDDEDKDTSLYHYLRSLDGRTADKLSGYEKLRIEDIINAYHKNHIRLESSDRTEFDKDDDSINQQIHVEKNGATNSIRSVSEKTPTGKSIIEETKVTSTLNDKDKTAYSYTDRTEHKSFKADEVKTQSITTERTNIDTKGNHDDLPKPATVLTTENSNGNITSVRCSFKVM